MTSAPAPRAGLIYADGSPVRTADVARIRARASLSGPSPSPFPYDAASLGGQEMANWWPFLRGPDTEINYDRDRMVARSRDLVRNDSWASGAISTALDSQIGWQFRLNCRPDSRALRTLDRRFDITWAAEFAAQVEAEWRLYADDPARWCDAGRKLTMTQLFYLAGRHKMVDGDALGMSLWAPERREAAGARYATTLQVIDPDRLSNPFQRMDTHDQRGGVQIDDLGAPIGYHIRRAHQGDWFDAMRSMEWDFYPRETPWGRAVVIHDLDMDRADQHRGLGVLSACLGRFKMLAKFDQVSLQAAVLRTMVGFFIKSAFGADDVESALRVDTDTKGNNYLAGPMSDYANFAAAARDQVTMGGARIPVLAPNEDIATVRAGDAATEFETFEAAFLRSIAAATGASATELSKDYRRVNYSSARADMLTAWRTLLRRRHGFAAGFATPFYATWLEELVVDHGRARVPLPRGVSLADYAQFRAAFARCGWIGPGRGWVDPVKERQGEILGLEAGFGTLSRTCAEVSGSDWREDAEQQAVERAYRASLNLPQPDWAGGRNQAPAPAEEREDVEA